MAAPTVQAVAKVVLRDWGIMWLDGATPSGQSNPIRQTDLDSVAMVLSSAFQEIADEEGIENKTKPGGAVLYAPTNVTLNVTDGSPVIAALTTSAAWMPGCTIRIAGDAQDNELLSTTLLARPFIGTGGNGVTATVYCDAITLDAAANTLGETEGRILSPMIAGGQWLVNEAKSRHEFLTLGGWALPGFYNEGYAGYPFWSLTSKPTDSSPLVFFTDGYYDPTLDYIVRRIRLSPMPTVRQSLGWTGAALPIRVTAAQVCATITGAAAETNVKIPCVNGWVESIYLPIARQIGTGFPQFKNDDLKPEIYRQYQRALNRLRGSSASVAGPQTLYT